MITDIIEDFTSVWSVFHHIDRQKALKQINNGGCGVAAYAIAEVLSAKGLKVDFYSNWWHAWIRIDDVDYDTLRPEGYEAPVCELWGAPCDNRVTEVDCYMRNNRLQTLLVKAFLERHNTPVPPFVKELIRSKPRLVKSTLKGWKEIKPRRVLNNLQHRYVKVKRLGAQQIAFTPIRPEIEKIEEDFDEA